MLKKLRVRVLLALAIVAAEARPVSELPRSTKELSKGEFFEYIC